MIDLPAFHVLPYDQSTTSKAYQATKQPHMRDLSNCTNTTNTLWEGFSLLWLFGVMYPKRYTPLS